MLDVLDRYGIWRRAGADATLAGLNVGEAMASIGDGLDRDFCRALFLVAEAPYVAAVWRHTQETEGVKKGTG